MLAEIMRLHDIDDVEAFVCATIERSGLRPHIQESEREDLIAEGITILYELAEKFEPHRAGYATAGRFSGFAAQFLPRRLGDAWHQRHPEHRRIAGEDGKRRWRYHDSPVSLDDYLTDHSTTSGPRGNRARLHRETLIRPREQWVTVAPN